MSRPRSIPLFNTPFQLVYLPVSFVLVVISRVAENLMTGSATGFLTPKSVGCLFRKCPPFNTPRYPPIQYPIEQKAAAYPPGTGGFNSQSNNSINKFENS